jgi:hypothetical protein
MRDVPLASLHRLVADLDEHSPFTREGLPISVRGRSSI